MSAEPVVDGSVGQEASRPSVRPTQVEASLELLRAIHDAIENQPHHRRLYVEIMAPLIADALLDGPLRETLRLARIGAALEALPEAAADYPATVEAICWAEGYNDALTDASAAGAALAAGSDESPQGDPT